MLPLLSPHVGFIRVAVAKNPVDGSTVTEDVPLHPVLVCVTVTVYGPGPRPVLSLAVEAEGDQA